MRSFVLFCLFTNALSCPAAWQSKWYCPDQLRKLAVFSYAPESQRSPTSKEFIRNYKNSPASQPRRYQLDVLESRNAMQSRLLQEARSAGAIEIPPNPSVYELKVLLLKKGDTVQFGDQSFVLGEFLGAGNSCHVFALDENRVLKIPFLATPPDFQTSNAQERLRQMQARLRKDVQLLASAKNAVPHQWDAQFRYLIADRIAGDLNGRELLTRYFPNVSKGPVTLNSVMDASDEASKRLKALVDAMMEDGFAVRRSEGIRLHIEDARQYLYDSIKERWFLVDGL